MKTMPIAIAARITTAMTVLRTLFQRCAASKFVPSSAIHASAPTFALRSRTWPGSGTRDVARALPDDHRRHRRFAGRSAARARRLQHLARTCGQHADRRRRRRRRDVARCRPRSAPRSDRRRPSGSRRAPSSRRRSRRTGAARAPASVRRAAELGDRVADRVAERLRGVEAARPDRAPSPATSPRACPAACRGRRSRISGIGSSVIALNVRKSESRWNSRGSTSISYITTASANTSLRRSSGLPRICSGHMYAFLPLTVPVRVREFAPRAFAMPKSSSFTVPSAVTMMFGGDTSRWTTPSNRRLSRAPRAPHASPRTPGR